MRGYDRKRQAKLVRHQDARYDVHDLLRRGWLEAYQGYQGRPIFDGCDFYCLIHRGRRNEGPVGRSLRVRRKLAGSDVPLPPGCPHAEWLKAPHFYELTREPGYEDLEDRVVIEWGKGALAWHQRPSNKEVVEILPKGQLRPPFRDYLEFTLTYAELVDLYRNKEANREWRARLAAVAGVYLILATTTGAKYVGSAHGDDGIWGRWADYARDGHGRNAMLEELPARDPAYPQAFSYSILQIAPKTVTQKDVLEMERRYKEKLGCRAMGLNAN